MNDQKPLKADYNDFGNLQVHSMWKTMQGEGPLAGVPAIFIRLYGCNLQCAGCDTEYTSNKKTHTPGDIVSRVVELVGDSAIQLVVFTGGEPFRQSISGAVFQLLESGFDVQIETNGMYDVADVDDRALIVCAPKTEKIHPSIYVRADAFKYVVQNGNTDDMDGLPINVLGGKSKVRVARPPMSFSRYHVYVQSFDEPSEVKRSGVRNAANLHTAVNVSMQFGYRLSLQQHKLLGLD